MKQRTSNYTIGDILGIIIPVRGNVSSIVGEVIEATEERIVIRPKNNLHHTKYISITQEILDNEEIAISKYN